MENRTQVRAPFKLGHYPARLSTRDLSHKADRLRALGSKVPINAVTGHVTSDQIQLSGNATYQELRSLPVEVMKHRHLRLPV
jgi:hypothetical protein